MGDVTTVFITETYHIYLWTNNSVFLKDMWPHVVKAIAWMIDGGTKGTGLPYRLQCTYDQLFLNLYDHNTFSPCSSSGRGAVLRVCLNKRGFLCRALVTMPRVERSKLLLSESYFFPRHTFRGQEDGPCILGNYFLKIKILVF